MKRWRKWSPWYLRAALRMQRDWLKDERGTDSDRINTAIEQLIQHASASLDGHPDPTEEALRYRVEGRTLCIDRTPNGSQYKQVDRAGSEL